MYKSSTDGRRSSFARCNLLNLEQVALLWAEDTNLDGNLSPVFDQQRRSEGDIFDVVSTQLDLDQHFMLDLVLSWFQVV